VLNPITSNEGSASLLQAASLTNHHDSETSGPWDPDSPVSPVAHSLWVETEEAELLLTFFRQSPRILWKVSDVIILLEKWCIRIDNLGRK
jgi:hypothetical protein